MNTAYNQIVNMVLFLISKFSKVDFRLRENLPMLIERVENNLGSCYMGINVAKVTEGILVKHFWPKLSYIKELPEDLEEIIRYDYCNFVDCELYVFDSRILDVPAKVEEDFLRLYRAKTSGQYNYFDDMSFYLDHVEEVGIGKSNFFWSYIRERHETIGFKQALKQAKIIIELGLLKCYDRYDVVEALDVAFYDSRALRFLKEFEVYEWESYREALQKASCIKFTSYDKFYEFIIGYTYGNNHIRFLREYTRHDFYQTDSSFYEKHFRQLRCVEKHNQSPTLFKWDIKSLEDEEFFLELLYGSSNRIRFWDYKDQKILLKNTLTKKGYFEEMSSWKKSGFFENVFKGELKTLSKDLSNNLKCSIKEAVEFLKKGWHRPEHFLNDELSWTFKNEADWTTVRWWLSKKDSAAWDRQRITYGPEGREFRFKFRSLIDEIRPCDLINGDKTSPEKAIEHACERRQKSVESMLGCDWTPLPSCELKGNEEFKQLTTPADLVAAGKHFSNCVATYVNACKDKRCYIFASDNICSEIYQDDNSNWRVRQCLSFHNSCPLETDRRRFDSWLDHAVLAWRQEQEAKKKIAA